MNFFDLPTMKFYTFFPSYFLPISGFFTKVIEFFCVCKYCLSEQGKFDSRYMSQTRHLR